MEYCESCGMPLKDGSISKKDRRYCINCQNQETGVLRTHKEVREGSIQAAINKFGKTRNEAEKMADDLLPNLPRWRK